MTVEVTHDKVHATDAGGAGPTAARHHESTASTVRSASTERSATTIGHVLLAIADRCPVHRTLEQSSLIETELREGTALV